MSPSVARREFLNAVQAVREMQGFRLVVLACQSSTCCLHEGECSQCNDPEFVKVACFIASDDGFQKFFRSCRNVAHPLVVTFVADDVERNVDTR